MAVAMDKQQILHEIKRIAEANGNAPGISVFERETGIKKHEWYPLLWLRWGDALADAGFAPNQLTVRFEDDFVLQRYIDLVRELGRLPVFGELRRKAKADSSFPSHAVFARFGGKNGLVAAAAAFCRQHAEYVDVADLFERDLKPSAEPEHEKKTKIVTGFVYLMKSGRHFKIGRTNALGRRHGELKIQIPVPPTTIHSIETDDPVGVEAYWHKRFAENRGAGEWFDLSPDDVSAFKRWKRIA
jgi:hypothetical protein